MPLRALTDQATTRQRTPSRIDGLDSLRALAIATVVGYHLGVPFLTGGFVGVTLFFVVSGYLITRLLLAEIEAEQGVNVIGFWMRRFRRLIPAAYLTILACLVWAAAVAPQLLPKVRGDSLAGFAYASNWWMIFHRVSYFDSFGLPSPLGHLWSLAIEEQFYLLWPIVLVLLVALVRRKAAIVTILSLAVLTSSAWMAMRYSPDADPSRAYLGTDTRAGELLLGALLAVALHFTPHEQPAHKSRSARQVVEMRAAPLLFVISVAVWATLAVSLSEYSPATFRGGILLSAIASAGMVMASQAPRAAALTRWLDRGVVGALGRRSYSIYLWHFPVLVALSTPNTYGTWSSGRAMAVVTFTLALAQLSYRYVEQPIRRVGFRATLRSSARILARVALPVRLALIGVTVAPLALAGAALAGISSPSAQHPHRAAGPTTVLAGQQPRAASTAEQPRPQPTHQLEPRRTPRPSHHRLTADSTVAVGDSLMIDIAVPLRAELPGITIDAQEGRQPWTGLDVASSYGQFNNQRGTYILGIGTNGAIDSRALIDFCRSHSAALIILITPKVNRPWESTSVSAIHAAAERCSNVRVADFHAAAIDHSEYFGPDGVHLTAAGEATMVRLIQRAARW